MVSSLVILSQRQLTNKFGLELGGEGGNGPRAFWLNSISLALSDLCTPGRNSRTRLGCGVSCKPSSPALITASSPRNSALILFSICFNGSVQLKSLNCSSSSSRVGARSVCGVVLLEALRSAEVKTVVVLVGFRALASKLTVVIGAAFHNNCTGTFVGNQIVADVIDNFLFKAGRSITCAVHAFTFLQQHAIVETAFGLQIER